MCCVIGRIKGCVAKDDLTCAVNLLIIFFNEDIEKQLHEAILISRELSAVVNASRVGIINWEQENLAKNRLAFRILELIEDK